MLLAVLWIFLFENEDFNPQIYLLIKFLGLVVLILLSYLFGRKEIIEIQDDKLCITQSRSKFSIEFNKIENLELIDLDREILLSAKGVNYNFKAYRFGKIKLEKFLAENDLLNKNNM